MLMESLKYEICINAPKAVVWNTLTDAETYRKWVKAFSPNSYFEGEWKQGTFMKFLDPEMGGTKAFLETLEPSDRILARHVSMIAQDGEETTEGEMCSKWIGTTEAYTLSEQGSSTALQIEIRTHDDFVPMFESAWPKALKSIKTLSE